MKIFVCYGAPLVLLFWAALLGINGSRLGVAPTVILMLALAVALAANLRNGYKNGPRGRDRSR